jgi:hypothetical protein
MALGGIASGVLTGIRDRPADSQALRRRKGYLDVI